MYIHYVQINTHVPCVIEQLSSSMGWGRVSIESIQYYWSHLSYCARHAQIWLFVLFESTIAIFNCPMQVDEINPPIFGGQFNISMFSVPCFDSSIKDATSLPLSLHSLAICWRHEDKSTQTTQSRLSEWVSEWVGEWVVTFVVFFSYWFNFLMFFFWILTPL